MADVGVFERDRAYQDLLRLVLAGEFEGDAPLSERKLAEKLGFGRTPVREAIRRLTREGLLEVQPARGTYVRKISVEDIQDIYEARIGIEGTAAYLAAQRGVTAAFSKFRSDFEKMSATPESFDLTEIHKAGQEFHVEMFRAARNRFLLEIYEPLRLKHSVALRLPRHYNHEWVIESVSEHLAILSAIEAGDAVKARKLVCEHLARGLEVRSQIFDDLAGSTQPEFKVRSIG